MKQLSTVTQLIEHLSTLINSLDQFQAVDVLYWDFAKAYDKVDFGLLIQMLHDLSIGGNMLDWISVFIMRGRKHRVKVNCVIGKEAEVLSGTCQILAHFYSFCSILLLQAF